MGIFSAVGIMALALVGLQIAGADGDGTRSVLTQATGPGGEPTPTAPVSEPEVQVSPMEIRLGDDVRLSGSGCVDPTTGSGNGLRVVSTWGAVEPVLFHDAAVAADGSFDAVATARQPHSAGDRLLSIRCVRVDDTDPLRSAGVWERSVRLLLVGAPFVVDGGDVEIGRPCTIVSPCDVPATAGSELQVEHLPLFATANYELQHLPGPISAGVTVTVPTGARLDPGSYIVRVTCMEATQPLAQFELTVRFVSVPAPSVATPRAATPPGALPRTG